MFYSAPSSLIDLNLNQASLVNAQVFHGIGALYEIRGGGDGDFLDRASFRISGLEEYGLISALLLSVALSLIDGTDKTWPDSTREKSMKKTINVICTYLFLLFSTCCVMFALYSTIIFALLALYTKTCLGLGDDDSFHSFMKATGFYRYRGFQCFIGSLGSFSLSFLLSLYLNFDCWPVLVMMCFLANILRKDTVEIMRLASHLIYSRMVVTATTN